MYLTKCILNKFMNYIYMDISKDKKRGPPDSVEQRSSTRLRTANAGSGVEQRSSTRLRTANAESAATAAGSALTGAPVPAGAEDSELEMDSILLTIQKVADASHDFENNVNIETVNNTLVKSCSKIFNNSTGFRYRYYDKLATHTIQIGHGNEDNVLRFIGITKKPGTNFLTNQYSPDGDVRKSMYNCINFSVKVNHNQREIPIHNITINNSDSDKSPQELQEKLQKLHEYLRNIYEPKLIIDFTFNDALKKILEFRQRDINPDGSLGDYSSIPKARFITNIPTTFDPANKTNPYSKASKSGAKTLLIGNETHIYGNEEITSLVVNQDETITDETITDETLTDNVLFVETPPLDKYNCSPPGTFNKSDLLSNYQLFGSRYQMLLCKKGVPKEEKMKEHQKQKHLLLL